MSVLNVQLPDNLWGIGLRDLNDSGSRNMGKRCGHVELDIGVLQLIDASAPKGIRAKSVLPNESCGTGALIDFEDDEASSVMLAIQ